MVEGHAAVGFTVKSGWAMAVLLVDASPRPRVADRRRVDLSDPAIPEARQPYHASMGTARAAGAELTRLVTSVQQFGQQSVMTAIRAYAAEGHSLAGAGLVVGSVGDPARIANDHIRIHAFEGQLFREVVQKAVADCGLRSTVWRERDLYAAASERLRRPEQQIRSEITALGRGVSGGWRAEHKAAAVAAWLVLESQ